MGYLKQYEEDSFYNNLPEEKHDEATRLIQQYMRTKKKRTRNKIFNRLDSMVKVKNNT